MAKKRGKREVRGRPPGPKTVRVAALLYPEQREELKFLSQHLEGRPAVTGLIREAVAGYLDKRMKVSDVREAYQVATSKALRVIK